MVDKNFAMAVAIAQTIARYRRDGHEIIDDDWVSSQYKEFHGIVTKKDGVMHMVIIQVFFDEDEFEKEPFDRNLYEKLMARWLKDNLDFTGNFKIEIDSVDMLIVSDKAMFVRHKTNCSYCR